MATPDYTFDSSKETPQQYLARTQGSNAQTAAPGGGASGAAPTSTTDPFVSALQQKLLNQSDMISSSNSGIDTKINAAIGGLQSASDKTDQASTLNYDQQISDAKGDQSNSVMGFLSAQNGGGGINVVALRTLTKTTDSQINQLEEQKQQAILQNDAATASKISDLQMQALQFQQTAQQQTFSNLLGIGNFGLQAKTQQDQEDQATSQIALQYGLTVQPGETLASLSSRATKDMGANSPAALAIKTAQAQIYASNASAAASISSTNANAPLNPDDLAMIGQFALSNPQAAYGLAKNPAQLAQIATAAAKAQSDNALVTANQNKQTGVTKVQAIQQATTQYGGNSASANPQALATTLAAIESSYGPDSAQPVPSSQTLLGQLGAANSAANNVGTALKNYFQ